jgi:hypothetical protein
MMIYNDSTTGTNISVNMPRVTPEMIRQAEQSKNHRLVIECLDHSSHATPTETKESPQPRRPILTTDDMDAMFTPIDLTPQPPLKSYQVFYIHAQTNIRAELFTLANNPDDAQTKCGESLGDKWLHAHTGEAR